MKKRIHVNQHNIRKNRKEGSNLPVFTVKTYKSNDYGHCVYFEGEGRLVYSPDKPLSCGAVAWLETEGKVTVEIHGKKCQYKIIK